MGRRLGGCLHREMARTTTTETARRRGPTTDIGTETGGHPVLRHAPMIETERGYRRDHRRGRTTGMTGTVGHPCTIAETAHHYATTTETAVHRLVPTKTTETVARRRGPTPEIGHRLAATTGIVPPRMAHPCTTTETAVHPATIPESGHRHG